MICHHAHIQCSHNSQPYCEFRLSKPKSLSLELFFRVEITCTLLLSRCRIPYYLHRIWLGQFNKHMLLDPQSFDRHVHLEPKLEINVSPVISSSLDSHFCPSIHTNTSKSRNLATVVTHCTTNQLVTLLRECLEET